MNSADHRGVAALNELETNEQSGHVNAPVGHGGFNVDPAASPKDTPADGRFFVLPDAPQPPQPAEADERAAFVAWLSGAYPHAWTEERAEHAWQCEYIVALAWQEQERRKRAALASKPVQGGVITGQWEGAEEWMPLAWELCANECGEEACTELIWEGGPVPEPWGDRWLKYEDQAKEMINMVRKHVPALSSAPAREPASEEQVLDKAPPGVTKHSYSKGWRDAERHHGICKE